MEGGQNVSSSDAASSIAGDIKELLKTDSGLEGVKMPKWESLPHELVFDSDGLPITSNIKAHFTNEGRLSEEDALSIIRRSASILKREPNVIHLDASVVVCGDMHGQFYDFLKVLEMGGDPKDQAYVFLGDYADRGSFGMEIVLLLMSYKIRYPDSLIMLRGNHESRHLTAYFNFKMEAKYKYSLEVYEEIMSAFDCLPLVCIVNKRFLCVHAGLSPEIQFVSDIELIHRFRETPSSGPMCDLLWADPATECDEEGAKGQLFKPNTIRGCSYTYSYEASCLFLERNDLLGIIRGHEAQSEGYRLYRTTPKGVPSVVCVFSAPNYCDTYDNRAAIIHIDGDVMNIRQYNSSPHPFYLPNFLNAFAWSLPFTVEKAVDVLNSLLFIINEEGSEEELVSPSAIDESIAEVQQRLNEMSLIAKEIQKLDLVEESCL